MATIASLNIAMSADSARLKRDLDKAGKRTQSFATKQKARLKGITSGVKGLGAAMGALAAGAGIKALLGSADALGKNADAAGISIEAYQRLRFGFEQAGISQAAFKKGTLKFSKVFNDAGKGLATATDALDQLGLSYEELEKLSPDERILAVAGALSEVEDAGTRAALAQETLGKEFASNPLDISSIIAAGEGISVISDEAAYGAAGMNDGMNQLSTTMSNLTTNVIVPMIAKLTPLIEGMANFAKDNQKMAMVIAGLLAVGAAVTLIGAPLLILTAAIGAAVAIWQNWDKIVASVTAYLAENFPTALKLITGYFDTVKAAANLFWDVLQSLGNFSFGDAFTNLQNMFDGLAEKVSVTFKAVFAGIGEFFLNIIKAPLNVIIDGLNTMMSKLPEIIGGGIHFEHFANGGFVSGPGNGTSDSIAARLSNGEFVINAAATARNRGLLEAINSNRPGFAAGGLVGSGRVPPPAGTSGNPIDPAEEGETFAESFVESFGDAMRTTLKSGNFKGFITGILQTISSKIIDNFVDNFVDGLMSSITSSFSDGGGFNLGGLFKSFFSSFGGMSDGGIVPHTPYSKIGQDSVPTMLTPGEVVVPVGESGVGGNTFNINVTGDISRQTRREIVGMMPQITSGVNANNKNSGIIT